MTLVDVHNRDGVVYAGRESDPNATRERPPDKLTRNGRTWSRHSDDYTKRKQFMLQARKLQRHGRYPWRIEGTEDLLK